MGCGITWDGSINVILYRQIQNKCSTAYLSIRNYNNAPIPCNSSYRIQPFLKLTYEYFLLKLLTFLGT